VVFFSSQAAGLFSIFFLMKIAAECPLLAHCIQPTSAASIVSSSYVERVSSLAGPQRQRAPRAAWRLAIHPQNAAGSERFVTGKAGSS